MYTWNDGTYLAHHGIKGQKWGERRFQNDDGSLTPAGRERYGYGTLKERSVAAVNAARQKWNGLTDKQKRAIGIGLAVGAAAIIISRNPEAASKALKSIGDKTLKTISASAERAGQAMVDGAMVSIGGIAISRLSEKLPTDDSVDRATRERNQVILDSTTAGIKAATNANANNSNSGQSNGKNVGKDVTDKLGSPSNKGVDRSSSEWQSLFKDSNGNQRDQQVRSTIKSLASAGYDISQIQSYIDMVERGTIRHSWNDGSYMIAVYSPYGRWRC